MKSPSVPLTKSVAKFEQKYDSGNISYSFLELASEQRIEILIHLNEKKSRVASMAEKLKVTPQEIHRNYDRLSEAGFIRKKSDGYYHITNSGRIVCTQIPFMNFLVKNDKFFERHFFGDIPFKFIHRLGELNGASLVQDVTSVLDRWKSIYTNADKFVFDIITEAPGGIEETLISKIKNGTKYRHVFDQKIKEPKNREKLLKKIGYYQLIQDGKIERKKTNATKIVMILNEKEGGIIFPDNKGCPDLRYMFYGNDPEFLDWCKDYFSFVWNKL